MTTDQILTEILETLKRSAPAPEVMDIRQVAQYMNVSEGTIYNMVALYDLPQFRLTNKCVRFRRSDVDRWLSGRRVTNQKNHCRIRVERGIA